MLLVLSAQQLAASTLRNCEANRCIKLSAEIMMLPPDRRGVPSAPKKDASLPSVTIASAARL